jgi:hypothetical protein
LEIITVSTELSTEVIQPRALVRQSLFDLDPDAQIEFAAKVANSLVKVIEKQHLYTNIQGRKYVRVEGWEVLGTFLGVLPRERNVTELPDGSYEAFVDLVRSSDGVVVGGASAICGTDEKRWSGADRYARRSMAITRAVGKAYRTCFSWIISLAGYEPVPAEEIPRREEEYYEATADQKRMLARIAEEAGVKDKAALKEISDAMINSKVRMSSLKNFVQGYLDSPLG